MKKIFAILMVVTMLGAFLAGCKSNDEGTSTTTGGTATGGTATGGTATGSTTGK